MQSSTPAKKRLAFLWFGSSGFLFFVAFIQTTLNVYPTQNGEVWSWLLPTIMPTLSLVMGVLVLDALRGVRSSPGVGGVLFRITFGLSIAYFIAILILFARMPFTSDPIQVLHQANFALGPFQGLVAAGMGAFFTNGDDTSPAP
jgi:hypothetical protein